MRRRVFGFDLGIASMVGQSLILIMNIMIWKLAKFWQTKQKAALKLLRERLLTAGYGVFR